MLEFVELSVFNIAMLSELLVLIIPLITDLRLVTCFWEYEGSMRFRCVEIPSVGLLILILKLVIVFATDR